MRPLRTVHPWALTLVLSLSLSCSGDAARPPAGADTGTPGAEPEPSDADDGGAPSAPTGDSGGAPRTGDAAPALRDAASGPRPTYDGLPGDHARSFEGRNYYMYVPSGYRNDTPIPLLVGFHGACRSGEDFYEHRGVERFRDATEPANFILVIPDTRGGCCCDEDGNICQDFILWTPTCEPSESAPQIGAEMDDIVAMIDHIALRYRIDPRQIHAFGHSDGGLFTGIGGMHQADRFASLTVFAMGWGGGYPLFLPSRPIPIQFICGEDDDPFCPNAQESALFFSDEGHPTRLEVVPDEGHGLKDLVDHLTAPDIFAWMTAHPLP